MTSPFSGVRRAVGNPGGLRIMSRVEKSEAGAFFRDVEEASKKAVWCAVATVEGDQPRVRIEMVRFTLE